MIAPRLHSLASIRFDDGSQLGYRQLGAGPGLILLHGGMMAAQGFMKLGAALADAFTVYIPDRRGRGISSVCTADHHHARDYADVRRLAEETGARRVFGLSSGAILALETALTMPQLELVAAYEPPYSLPGHDNSEWQPRFDRELQQGELAAAMVTVLKGTGDSPWLKLAPRLLLVPRLRRAIEAEAKRVRPGDVPLRELIPTMHFDAELVRATSPGLERLARMPATVLLLGGSRSAGFLKRGLDRLESILPRVSRVELPRVGHLAASNGGEPERVASELRRFFA